MRKHCLNIYQREVSSGSLTKSVASSICKSDASPISSASSKFSFFRDGGLPPAKYGIYITHVTNKYPATQWHLTFCKLQME